jgi:hypothetical protein
VDYWIIGLMGFGSAIAKTFPHPAEQGSSWRGEFFEARKKSTWRTLDITRRIH